MTQKTNTQTINLEPYASSSYSYAWKQMWKYPLELLCIFAILILLSIPLAWLGGSEEYSYTYNPMMRLFSLCYLILFYAPLKYGVDYAYLKAARNEKLEIKDMFEVFQNYGNAILANILTGFIIGCGFIFLVVPGIIFACKLAFVPYLIVDEKLDAIEAVKKSWEMTTGHAGAVFLIGLISIPISFAGFICLGVGIVPAAIWIDMALAALFFAVSPKPKKTPKKTK